MKKQLLVLLLAVNSLLLFSCQKASPDQPAGASGSNISNGNGNDVILGRRDGPGGCDPTTVELTAGQTINSGTVSVTNDENFIYVTYTTANGYFLTQTHLYVGDCALIPVNGQGNPLPGHFPYSSTHSNITTYTYQVPISSINSCGCIAAHAVVVKLGASGNVIETQTGWGHGTRINPNGGNWGMKFEYCNCL